MSEEPLSSAKAEGPLSRLFESEKAADAVTAIIATVTTIITSASVFRENIIKPAMGPLSLKIVSLEIASDQKPKVTKRQPDNARNATKDAVQLEGDRAGKRTDSKIGTSDDREFISVSISGVITNTTNSKISILKPNWILYGHTQDSGKDLAPGAKAMFKASRRVLREIDKSLSEPVSSVARVSLSIKDNELYKSDISTSAASEKSEKYKYFLGMGPLGTEDLLEPSQEMRFRRIMLIPSGPGYQYIEATVNIPYLRHTQLLQKTNLIAYSGCIALGWPPKKCASFRSSTDTTPSIIDKDFIIDKGLMKTYFCRSLPFSESNPQLRLSEIHSIYELSPFKSLVKSGIEKPPDLRISAMFCSDAANGLASKDSEALGASVLTVVHEETLSP